MKSPHAKSPGSEIDFTLDWGGQYLASGESIVSDLGWSIRPDQPEGLVILHTTSHGQTTSARLAGGQLGDRYLVTNAVITDQGREIHRALTIRIAHT